MTENGGVFSSNQQAQVIGHFLVVHANSAPLVSQLAAHRAFEAQPGRSGLCAKKVLSQGHATSSAQHHVGTHLALIELAQRIQIAHMLKLVPGRQLGLGRKAGI